MIRKASMAWVLGALLAPGSASAVSLIVDRLGTPDVVQAGDSVSFSFAFQFGPDEILEATQAEISAPHLSDFKFVKARSLWDLSADFRQIDGGGNPMWVYAENAMGEDPAGVTWEEVGGLAPLGRFSAIAIYDGEIEFELSRWVLTLLNGPAVPIDPAWERIRTGVTVIGGSELPPPPLSPPPPVAALPPAPPPVSYPYTEDAPGPQGPTNAFYPATEDLDPRLVYVHADRPYTRRGGSLAFTAAILREGSYAVAFPMAEGAVPEPPRTLLILLAGVLMALRRGVKPGDPADT